MDEDLLDASMRELREETGLQIESLHQLGAFGKPGRDPRGRNISIVFCGLYNGSTSDVRGADDAKEARFVAIDTVEQLAFDHGEILKSAQEWLENYTI